MKRDVQPGRCVYCGVPCEGEACGSHADLVRIEAATNRNHGEMSVEDGDK